MLKLLLGSAAIVAASLTIGTPLDAKGPKPPPAPTECQLDISGRMQCAYQSYTDCRTALRSLRHDHPDVYGCWLSTADPTWWHYGLYVLEYYP